MTQFVSSSPVPPTTDPAAAEPGYLTTEFWATTAVSVVGFLASAGVFDQATAVRLGGLITSAATIVGYAISRGVRKSGTPGG